MSTEVASDTELLREYARRTEHKAELEAELLKVKAKLEELEPQVIGYFERESIQSVTIEGRTIFLRRELWAGRDEGVTSQQAIEALRAAGLDSFVEPKLNTQQLSAFCRELDKDGRPLPPSFAGVIKVSEKFRAGARKHDGGR